MKRLLALATLIGIVFNTGCALGGELRVGAAQTVITPPPGTPLAGYYGMRASAGVLDDIFVKALVFEQDGAKAAIVICDLIGLPRHIVEAARALIEKQMGIADVLLAATHTHTAPVLARESSMDELVGATLDISRSYTARLPALIAEAVANANTQLAPAHAFAAKGRVENLAFNRRYWMDDGTVAWNPGKKNAHIVAPAGPHDPEVGVLYFAGAAEQGIACFVNYAMHPDTTGGLKISADYPGVAARRLGDHPVGDRDAPAGRMLEARDAAQGRGLAAARRAQQHHDLARRHVEAHAVDGRLDAGREPLLQLFDEERRAHWRYP